MLTFGSLFSGVGGLDLAVAEVTGTEPAWHCEVDPHASTVLAERFPDVPNLGSVERDWSDVPPVDFLCGGFPCQDVSTAGLGAGIKEGTRSGLWFSYADAIRHLRPRAVFVENVAALTIRGLDVVLGSLAELGYSAEWGCLRASDVGAPHQRNRLWLVAFPEDERHERPGGAWGWRDGSSDDGHAAASPDQSGSQGRGEHRLASREGEAPALDRGARWGDYWPAIERWERITGRPAPDPTDERGRLNARLAEWMMGWPDGWVTDLLPRSPALRCIGNGVAPQQAVAAYRQLLDRAFAHDLEGVR